MRLECSFYWCTIARLALRWGMTTRPYGFFLAALLIASGSSLAQGQTKASDESAPQQSQISSLGQALSNPKHLTVHILYIHGIGVDQPGSSWEFQHRLCQSFLKNCKLPKVPVPTGPPEYAAGEAFANDNVPTLRYMGGRVWSSSDDWAASKPFVDHYVLNRSDGEPVVVDEINWWPLVLALKCRKIMTGEAYLAGPDKDLLNLCSGRASSDDRYGPKPYAWIKPEDADKLELERTRAARFNRSVKNNLMDWGFSDPMMAVGPMSDLFHEAMEELFVESARFNADGTRSNDWQQKFRENKQDREFVVISHSLGSFLVFSTLRESVTKAKECFPPKNESDAPAGTGAAATTHTDSCAASYILARTSVVYFMANQVPLLQLATMTEAQDLSAQIEIWRNLRKNFGETHITAFSDPDDFLSWHFPKLSHAEVLNCQVRNTFWRWLIANPYGAHVNYAKNKNVVGIMVHPETYGAHACKAPE